MEGLGEETGRVDRASNGDEGLGATGQQPRGQVVAQPEDAQGAERTSFSQAHQGQQAHPTRKGTQALSGQNGTAR